MEGECSIFTDGGCSGNPGPGGWAFLILVETPQGAKITVMNKGAAEETTNNRMELAAVIEALRAFQAMEARPPRARVCTDSQYVQKGISEWITKWKRGGWKTSGRKPVKNKDLWMELDALAAALPLDWEWVRGHAGNPYNELCDSMVQEAISSITGAASSFLE